MFQQKLAFKNSRNLTLSAIFEGEDKSNPVVIICHGFGSSKDSITYKNLTPKLLQRKLSVFRFDFTGCGQSEGDLSDLTPFVGLDDLRSVVKSFDLSGFGVCGTSFGGYVALLYESENPSRALALRSPVSDWREVVTEDIERIDSFLVEVNDIDIYQRVKSIKVPTLIIHGDKDDVVPIEQSKRLYDSLGGTKRLEILHGVTHDIKDEPEFLEKSNSLIADFFEETLLNLQKGVK